MQEFIFRNPTKLIFGKGQLERLKEEVPRYGKKVLLVYGGGSIKRNGLYDEVMKMLGEIGAEVAELPGGGAEPARLDRKKRGGHLQEGRHRVFACRRRRQRHRLHESDRRWSEI